MNVVDSSGWLAFFADEKNAGQFLPILEDTASLVVPSITIYEVFKVILRESGENAALQASVAMQRGKVVDVDTGLAMKAAKLGLKHNLPMAGSIILATAQMHDAVLWTQDTDFKNIPGVKFLPKK
ncbi:MAG TPA: type II toxin-antitoxin system VapC family toxin [Deltaproteobacteria bacterium]|nr:type II toxin-antitoxin system VapC family toxin [Deltaproteobacteria bacterium]